MEYTQKQKKQWSSPEVILISDHEIEAKVSNAYNEKTLISSGPFTSSPGFNELRFIKNPAGIVTFLKGSDFGS
jgi:hypothetical protein